mmetsp:Transcript_29053/g.63641  ORF Transcript_29053/g.63641 Transcript_29053/m.63641 type:complete len:243 (-) Transcript_29053:2473-3201(-)
MYQGDDHQLHRNARGARGPAARAGGARGASRPGEAEEQPGRVARRRQEAAEGARGQDPAPALAVGGKYLGRRGAHQHALRLQGNVRRDPRARARGGGDGDQDQRDAIWIHACRNARIDPLLHHRRPRPHRRHVPVLARVLQRALPHVYTEVDAVQRPDHAPRQHHEVRLGHHLQQRVSRALWRAQDHLLLHDGHRDQAQRGRNLGGRVGALPGRRRHRRRGLIACLSLRFRAVDVGPPLHDV